MTIGVVSFSFSWCSTGGPDAQLYGECWLALPHLVSYFSGSQITGGSRGPLRPGVALPTTPYHQLPFLQLFWLPVLTELYNSSTPAQSPTQTLEWHVWSSSSGNNCHAVQRVTLFRCISLWVYHGLLPCPISLAKSTYAISFDYWPLGCVTSFRCITWKWYVWPGRRSKYNIMSPVFPTIYSLLEGELLDSYI